MKKMTTWVISLLLLLALTGCYGREEGTTEGLTNQSGANVQTHFNENSENKDEGNEWEEVSGVNIVSEEQQTDTSDSYYEEVESDSSYFADVLFIGDSRTVGLKEYGSFENADYFATPGLSVYTISKTEIAVGDTEEITLEELLEQKDYGKIYLMLGMNELGYDYEQTVERYRAFVDDLQAKEPDAILYLCANMHVTITRSENDEIYNNISINKINDEIKKLAEEKNLPFLDINVLFDDEEGNLDVDYASDDSHVLGQYYESWCDWLQERTVVKK